MTADDDPVYKKKIVERRARLAEQMQINDREARKVMCNYEQLKKVSVLRSCWVTVGLSGSFLGVTHSDTV